MAPEVLVGLLSLAGTLIGAFAGIMTSNKLVNYRIEQLERKVDKHNNLIERMYGAEKKIDLLNEKLHVLERGDDGK